MSGQRILMQVYVQTLADIVGPNSFTEQDFARLSLLQEWGQDLDDRGFAAGRQKLDAKPFPQPGSVDPRMPKSMVLPVPDEGTRPALSDTKPLKSMSDLVPDEGTRPVDIDTRPPVIQRGGRMDPFVQDPQPYVDPGLRAAVEDDPAEDPAGEEGGNPNFQDPEAAGEVIDTTAPAGGAFDYSKHDKLANS